MRFGSLQTARGLAVIFILYVVSFCLPAIYFRTVSTNPTGSTPTPAGYTTKSGIQMAFASLCGPLVGNFAGLANPLMIAGCVLLFLRRGRPALICLALAAVFALQSFQLIFRPYYEDEAGVMLSYMLHPLVGWYCWFGAILLALALAALQ
jgi:hypothetical protein